MSAQRGARGPLRFARYALAPNALGYCGPADPGELAGALGATDAPAVALLAPAFLAAFPYLRLIASSADIADPLDERVVEGYWLGGPLARAVPPQALAESLDERFAALAGRLRPVLGEAALAGGVACHSLHVLAATPFGALVRDSPRGVALEVCDACRIRPARVRARAGASIVVAVASLAVAGGRLVLGPVHEETATLGPGALDAGAGDLVALHWGIACERLDDRRARALRTSTAANLAAVNATGRPAPLVAAETLGS